MALAARAAPALRVWPEGLGVPDGFSAEPGCGRVETGPLGTPAPEAALEPSHVG